jgi:hypothetical protein
VDGGTAAVRYSSRRSAPDATDLCESFIAEKFSANTFSIIETERLDRQKPQFGGTKRITIFRISAKVDRF